MEKGVKVGVAVHVLNDENEFLLLKRISKLGNNTWCATGGKMIFGETIEQSAMREFREEVGDDIIITDPIFYTVTNDYFETEQEHYITIHMISQYISGEPKRNEPEKCSEIGWFDSSTMKKMDLFLPMIDFLKYNDDENEMDEYFVFN